MLTTVTRSWSSRGLRASVWHFSQSTACLSGLMQNADTRHPQLSTLPKLLHDAPPTRHDRVEMNTPLFRIWRVRSWLTNSQPVLWIIGANSAPTPNIPKIGAALAYFSHSTPRPVDHV